MNHSLYIKRCLELSQLAKGFTAPNPMVGAVLVHGERIIGEGWHHVYGQAHAEVNCFDSVAAADKHLIPASRMYVSLEPCAHYGKTPPCALRIINEGVKEVFICNVDPFAKVGGKGIQMLHEAGVTTYTGIMEAEGSWLNRRFFCFHQQSRPYIILKWAQTANGLLAPADKSRFQITGSESQQLVHRWRTEEAAIMVGFQTALSDDPQLTARLWQGNQPLRIALDRNLQLPTSLKLFQPDAPTWIVNGIKEAEEGHLKYVRLDFEKDVLQQLMKRLHQAGRLSLIVEGGAQLLNSFIQSGLWDEARIFTGNKTLDDGIAAPLITNGRPAFETLCGDDRLQVYVNKENKYAVDNLQFANWQL